MKTLLTIGQASRILGISQKHIRDGEDSGELIPVRTEGGHRRYHPADVEAFRAKLGGHLISVQRAADLCHVSRSNFEHHRRQNYIPEPPVTLGERRYYTEDQIEQLQEHFRKPLVDIRREMNLYGRSEAARELGISPDTLTRFVRTKLLPPATHRAKGRRLYYHRAELDAIRAQIAAYVRNPNPHPANALAAGLYSLEQASQKMKMPKVTLDMWLRKGEVERPQRRAPGLTYPLYDDTDLLEIKRRKRDYFLTKMKML